MPVCNATVHSTAGLGKILNGKIYQLIRSSWTYGAVQPQLEVYVLYAVLLVRTLLCSLKCVEIV